MAAGWGGQVPSRDMQMHVLLGSSLIHCGAAAAVFFLDRIVFPAGGFISWHFFCLFPLSEEIFMLFFALTCQVYKVLGTHLRSCVLQTELDDTYKYDIKYKLINIDME